MNNMYAKLIPPNTLSSISFVSNLSNLTPTLSFDDCIVDSCCNQEKGNNPMSNTERDYLNRRINDIMHTKRAELSKQFHLYEEIGPKNYKELIDWVKTGKYTIDLKISKRIEALEADDEDFYRGPFYGIVWNGRGYVNDYDGYAVAEKELEKARTAAKDVVNTLDAAEGLKAVQSFETWSYTTPKKR